MLRALMMAALLVSPLCLAQPVYRCPGVAGISYQDQPCAGPGEVLILQTYRPTPGEVARGERRREAVRRFLRVSRLRRIEAAREIAPLPTLPDAEVVSAAEPPRRKIKVILVLSPGRHGHKAFARHRIIRHRPGTTVCPLGLVHCKKVWRAPAFRSGGPRQAYRPAVGAERRLRID